MPYLHYPRKAGKATKRNNQHSEWVIGQCILKGGHWTLETMWDLILDIGNIECLVRCRIAYWTLNIKHWILNIEHWGRCGTQNLGAQDEVPPEKPWGLNVKNCVEYQKEIEDKSWNLFLKIYLNQPHRGWTHPVIRSALRENLILFYKWSCQAVKWIICHTLELVVI